MYFHTGAGYNPFLIRNGWQVAQLNFIPSLAASSLKQVERHDETDEVFVLFKGASVLIAACETADGLQFTACRMQPGVTYNIPAGVWHAIAMTPDALVLIVERSQTHLNDVRYRDLTLAEYDSLQTAISG